MVELIVVTTPKGSFWHLATKADPSRTLCGRDVERVRFDHYENVDCRNCDHKATGARRTR